MGYRLSEIAPSCDEAHYYGISSAVATGDLCPQPGAFKCGGFIGDTWNPQDVFGLNYAEGWE